MLIALIIIAICCGIGSGLMDGPGGPHGAPPPPPPPGGFRDLPGGFRGPDGPPFH